MKKQLLTAFYALLASFGFAQTAVNFAGNDCAGNPHDFFSEMDNGKVIVLCLVMPCGACITHAKTTYNVVEGYKTTNPGKVVFYLADSDASIATCATINSWATTNTMPNSTKFSSVAIKGTDYAPAAMQKTIVMCGPNHTVVYNKNGSSNTTSALKSAIDGCLTTGISDPKGLVAELQVFPNPADNSTVMSYSLSNASDIKIEIYNVLGEKTKSVFSGKKTAGEYQVNIDCSDLNNGIYFVKLITGEIEKSVMLSVSH